MANARDADPAAGFRRRLAAIRAARELPEAFASDVEAAARTAVERFDDAALAAGRVDLTALGFVTLDPASSVDLDQAFALDRDGDDVVLHYALADIAPFAPAGGVVEQAAWERGVTVYLPDGRVPVYPTVLCERAASLLPDGPRPAIVLDVAVAPDGTCTLRQARRAVVASRAKLAYETTSMADLPPLAVELHRRISDAEVRRGATKVDWPEQQVEPDPSSPSGVNLVLRPMLPSEEANSSLSLAANFAVANAQLVAKSGLFRVMPDPDEARQQSLERTARALGITWPASGGLRALMPTLDPTNPRHKRFLVEARRVGRGASYAVYDPATPPFHSALAAPYAHATAPMRRLADRYVLEHTLALVDGRSTADLDETLAKLPAVMARADARASAVDRDVVDLVEALELEGRVGEEFAASVMDSGRAGTVVQLTDPPVRARIAGASSYDEGAVLTVRLLAVDADTHSVRFEIVGRSR